MTQFRVILLDDLAIAWWRNQATVTVNDYLELSYMKGR